MPNKKNELVQLHTEWRDIESLGIEDAAAGSNDDANETVVDAVTMTSSNNNVDGSVVPTADGEPIVDTMPSVRDDFVADEGDIGENTIPYVSI